MSTKLSRSAMLETMKNRDARYDGVFFVGVKTMKIYCLPSRKAKLPLRKNVVFFSEQDEALASNYRPCLRCKPDMFPNTEPAWIERCLAHLGEHTDRRILDQELAAVAGVEISTLRRAFAASFAKTPSGYHREMRLRRAARALSRRKPVLQVSGDAGFESLSGFVAAFRKQFGVSPGSYGRG